MLDFKTLLHYNQLKQTRETKQMYKVITTVIKDEDNKEISSYGIKSDNLVFKDISTDYKKINQLCALCNKLELSELHIKDVIDDFLYDNQ